MRQDDYKKLIELSSVGGGFIPANQNGIDLLDRTGKGEIITVQEVTARDIKFHKCYFALLGFIYDYLPVSFSKNVVSKEDFYIWLKHLKGEYTIKYVFKDKTQLIEYTSLAFGKMTQKEFEAYVAEQLPFIYSNVLGAYFELDMLNGIIETVEKEFKTMISKLP